MHYPKISFASNYPTLGPRWMANEDINGRACSIELYLGRDVLTKGEGFISVQWKGFDERVKRYQGEIQEKDMLKTKFFDKLSAAKKTSGADPSGDWENMKILLNAIFNAFNEWEGQF